MNKTKYLLIAAVGFALSLVSCKKEVYAPGEADEAGCYGVYFPEGQGGEISLDPSDDAKLSFTAVRKLDEGEITVPVTFTVTYEGEEGTETAEEIFYIDDIVFEDGQTETKFEVGFPNAAVGTTYTGSISLTDGKYVSRYGTNPVSINFSVARVKWDRVYGKLVDGKWTKTTEDDPDKVEYGSWRDDIFSSMFNFSSLYATNDRLEIYERHDWPGYYRIQNVYNPYMLAQFWGNAYPEEEFEENCTAGTYSYIDATDSENVGFPYQTTGAFVGSDGYVEFYSPTEADGSYTYPGTLENGVINFPIKGIYVNFTVSGGPYAGNSSGKTTILLPGAVMSDYSIAVEVGEAEDGDLPVAFTLGADVTKAVYGVYEGKLDDGEIYENRVALESDADAETVDLENPSIVLSDMSTGYYTIIAVSFDKDGNPSKNTSATFSYIAKGDEKPVVVSCGVNSAEKYVPQGKSTDNTIEFYVYGENLTEVKFGAVKKTEIVSDAASVEKKILATKSVEKDVLKAINGTGYVGTVSGLLPGTEYHLVVYASNGYESTVKVSESSVTTTGDPLPIYENYTAADIDETLLPEASEGYFGKYNFYAVDQYGKLGLREYISKVTIADSEIADSEPDEDGLKDEYVEIAGMLSSAVTDVLRLDKPFDDTMTWDCYDGILYSLDQTLGAAGSYWIYPYYSTSAGKIYYGNDFCLIGGFVKEGYVAFIGYPYYASTYGLEFNGIYVTAFNDEEYSSRAGVLAWYTDLLLVDEAKDDNGVAPSAAKATTAELHRISEEISSIKFNCVQPEKIQIREAIRNAKSSVRIYTDFVGAEGRIPVKAADFKVRAGQPQNAGTATGTASASAPRKLRADLIR